MPSLNPAIKNKQKNMKKTHTFTSKIENALQAKRSKSKNKHQNKRAYLHTFKNGSLTIEAALIIPLFIAFLVSILGFINLTAIELENQVKLDSKARSASRVVALANVESEIFLIDNVQYKFLFLPESIGKVNVVQHCKSRAWVGSKIEEDDTEETVYITETGTVYHKSTSCSHLKLSIKAEAKNSINEIRNANGGKYKKCEICGKRTSGAMIYITEYGDRYHTDISCSGLKRTIKAVKLSQVGDRGKCSRCWS